MNLNLVFEFKNGLTAMIHRSDADALCNNGIITAADVHPDYTKRSEPLKKVVEKLKKIKENE